MGLVATLLDDKGFATFAGRPIVIAGRLANPNAADEVVVAKETADLLHLEVGDRAGFTAYRSRADGRAMCQRARLVG